MAHFFGILTGWFLGSFAISIFHALSWLFLLLPLTLFTREPIALYFNYFWAVVGIYFAWFGVTGGLVLIAKANEKPTPAA